MRERSPVRATIRAVGFGCLMLGSGIAGYVGWLLWGTGLETAKAQEQLRTVVTRRWDDPVPPPAKEERYLPGEAYAAIVIPSIDVDFVVVEGPENASYRSYEWTSALKRGPAHYPDSADPWDGTGRVGIAGHRTTYLHPFLNLDRVGPGDRIRVITKHGTFVYKVDHNSGSIEPASARTGSFWIEEASSGAVLAQTEQPTLVLTTCHPKYSSRQRWIVTATLERASVPDRG